METMVEPNTDLVAVVHEMTSAMSEATNCLCILLEWNDAGAIGDPPVDGGKLADAMRALERAFRMILHGPLHEALRDGRISPLDPPIVEDDLTRVVKIVELIPAWTSMGALPSDLVTLGEDCVRALWGATWQEIIAAAPPRPAHLS